MKTTGEFLIEQLAAWGVDTLFGIPGVHTVELYRGIAASGLRHISPRHEQGAGFMADGYARATGKVGVCLIITGPGMTNMLTAMAQAYADSIPMLVISSVNERARLQQGNGYLHELPHQQALIAGVTAFSHTVMDCTQLSHSLARAFAVFEGERPRPVHIELPLDVLCSPADQLRLLARPMVSRPAPDPQAITIAWNKLASAKRPILLLGGGCVDASEEARQLAILLDAPTLLTINGKGILHPDHPLLLGSYQSLAVVRQWVAKADVVLAIGTELGETDYDVVFDGGFVINGELIRIDIDPRQLCRNYQPAIAIQSDARLAICALLATATTHQLTQATQRRSGCAQVKQWREQLRPQLAAYRAHQLIFEHILAVYPNARFVGDSMQLVYSGNTMMNMSSPRCWFNSSTGYGTLGYALPAAIGAQLADSSRPVICLIGDGGLQFTLPELASAVEAKCAVIILLWNNQGYAEIKRYMQQKQITPIAVDIYTPDFMQIAHGFGCMAAIAQDGAHLQQLLHQAPDDRPFVIELNEGIYK